MNSAEMLLDWNREVMAKLALPNNRSVFKELVARGTLLFEPAEIAQDVSEFLAVLPQQLLDVYGRTDGFIVPCMDAEDGRFLRLSEIKRLDEVQLNVSFPSGGQERARFTSQMVGSSLLLSEMIDSAFYALNRYDGSVWALFHHGEDTRYENFEQFLMGETSRILQLL